MAYRLERGEPVPEGIRRIACEQLEGAIQSLQRTRGRDEAIHDARKRLKKTRALLRLVRPQLGDLYTEENARLRDTGLALSEFRDAAVIIETFDALRAKFPAGFAQAARVRRFLVSEKTRIERSGRIGEALAKIVSQLAAAARRVNRWTLEEDGFDAIGPGLQRIFRDGRKALKAARHDPRAENFHEWRKRVKAHWYHVRLLEPLWNQELKRREASLKELEDSLGIDHNLEVLRAKAGPWAAGLLPLIERYQGELRARALEIGEPLYRERPRDFRRAVGELWQAWSSSNPRSRQAKTRAVRPKSQSSGQSRDRRASVPASLP